jgi:Coiled-coil domain-containing protein 124 /Oxs1
MPPKKGGGGVNSKSAVGKAKKAENEAVKKDTERKKVEAVVAEDWQKGANAKKQSREEEAAMKADEVARKRREKQALLEAEEAGLVGVAKKAGPTAASKKKVKKKDDLGLLEDALVKSADKNAKLKKEEALKKQQQQKEEQERAAAKRKEEAVEDPLMANTAAMLGTTDLEDVGRHANIARMEADGTSGLDGALQSLDIKVPTDAKSAKALYLEFEARMLPQMKEEYPGLRLSQYKDKIFQMWKKSPENPANMIQVPSS